MRNVRNERYAFATVDLDQPTYPRSLIITKTSLFKYTENFSTKK